MCGVLHQAEKAIVRVGLGAADWVLAGPGGWPERVQLPNTRRRAEINIIGKKSVSRVCTFLLQFELDCAG